MAFPRNPEKPVGVGWKCKGVKEWTEGYLSIMLGLVGYVRFQENLSTKESAIDICCYNFDKVIFIFCYF